jgi:hydroxypyruvate isomerase
MFDLSSNLEYMFQEAGEDLADRIALAASSGFRKVEMFTTTNRNIAALGQSLARNQVELWTVLADPRTLLVDPDTHEGFRQLFRRAAEDAKSLGCSRVVVGSGPGVPYQKRATQLQTVTRAVASLVTIAEQLDVTILLEAVNTRVDHPGVLFSRTDDSVAVVKGVASPRVRLLYDLYHSISEGEDPVIVLPAVIDLVGHVQIADVPGRGEPGSGQLDWPRHLTLLRELGYRGVIGIECQPTKASTAEAVAYIRRLCSEAVD